MNETRSFRSILEIFWRRRIEFAALLVLATVVTFFAATHVKAKYSATATVLLVAEPPDNTDRQNPTTVQKPLLTGDLPALIVSETVLQRFRERVHSKLADGALRSHIKARVGGDSNLVPIEFSAASPDVAVEGANALATETTRYYREIATSRFDSLVSDFKSELTIRARKLHELERALQSLAAAYPYVDTKDGSSSVYDRLVRLRSERDEIAATVDADRAQAKTTGKRIAQARPLAGSPLADVPRPDLSGPHRLEGDRRARHGRCPCDGDVRAVCERQRRAARIPEGSAQEPARRHDGDRLVRAGLGDHAPVPAFCGGAWTACRRT